MTEYGFLIGKRLIKIEANTEQKAIIELVSNDECWKLIDKYEKIELYGSTHIVEDN